MSVTDSAAATANLEDLRNDKSNTNWVLFGYKESQEAVRVVGTGSGGLAEAAEKMVDDEVTYAVLRVVVTEAEFSSNKFVFLSWVGPACKPMLKARSSQHRLPIYKFINTVLQLAGELQATSREELSEDKILEKLSMSKVKGAAEAATDASGGAYVAKGGSTVQFQWANESAVVSSLQDLHKHNLNWLGFGYSNEDGPIQIIGSGKGDLPEVHHLLQQDKVVYILMGMKPTDGDYTLIKFILLTWVGPEVKPLHRARSSQHRLDIYNFTKKHVGVAGEAQATKADEVSTQLLIEKLSLSKDRDQDALRAAAQADAAKKANKGAPTPAGPPAGSQESFDVPVEDIEAAKAAVSELANHSTHTNWVAFGYEQGKTKAKVLGKGSGDISSFVSFLVDDALVYIVYAASVPDEDYSVTKHIFISWVGNQVKPMLKARSSQHRVPLYNFVNKLVALAGEMQVLSKEELTPELIIQKLSCSRQTGDSKADAAKPKTQAAPKAAGKSEKSFNFRDDNAAKSAVSSLHGDTEGKKWVLFGHAAQVDIIEILGTGSDGLSGFKTLLKDDAISYGVLAVKCPDESAGSGYTVVKNIFISWVGPDVKPMTKARSSQIRVALYTYLKTVLQMHGELQALTQDELTDKIIQEKLSGSRQN